MKYIFPADTMFNKTDYEAEEIKVREFLERFDKYLKRLKVK
jgi:hypothetical protein